MTEEKTLSERVFEEVRDALTQEGTLGEAFLVENDICRRFGVSRTTAARVLRRLTDMGYLRLYPHKGYRLNALGAADYRKMMRLRRAVERMVVSAAVKEAPKERVRALLREVEAGQMLNMDFHLRLAALLEDDLTMETLQRLLGMQEVTLRRAGKRPAMRGEHLEILEAILSGDEGAALAALDRDLEG
jgi:DNA-binding GntR family transcriptional regulator